MAYRLFQDGATPEAKAELITDLLAGYFKPGKDQIANRARYCNLIVRIRGLGVDPDPYVVIDRWGDASTAP